MKSQSSCFVTISVSVLILIISSLLICVTDAYPKINPSFQVYSERRSTRFFGNMSVTSGESDVLLNILYSYPTTINWVLIKDGFNVYERSRITTRHNTTTLSCVTTYDSGIYSFVQHDPLNTGFNVQTAQFNLTVLGQDKNEELLSFRTKPSHNALNGQSFPIQPIIHFQNGGGRIEPFIVKSPGSTNSISTKSKIPNNLITYTSANINHANNLVTFTGLAIIGEPGEYTIGFVTTEGCSVLIYDQPINVVPEWPLTIMIIGVSLLISFAMVFISASVKLLIGYRRTGRFSISTFLHTMQAPIDEVLGKHIALSTYFKVLRLFLVQATLFTIISLVPYLPITKTGDNILTGTYSLSQSNWSVESSFLYSYAILACLLFVSVIVIYTRFNDERIYHSHDSNHLVTSRSVMLTGLPKSLVDCNILKNYLQTSYSKGIYSVTIILEKHFSQKETELDLDGKIDSIYLSSGLSSSNSNNSNSSNNNSNGNNSNNNVGNLSKNDNDDNDNDRHCVSINDQNNININNDNLEPLKSTGTAFITFSCVSDAHLFKTQFSPYRFAWVKDVYPVAPPQFQIELQMRRWKSYYVAPVPDLLWTKLHNPSRLYGPALTTFLVALSYIFFGILSLLATLIYDSQFEKFKSYSFIHYKRRNGDEITLTMYSFWFYIFLPCCILIFVNRIIPPCISTIFKKSWITVRSSLKSKTLTATFYAQVFSIIMVPSFYFMMTMGMLTGQNFFYIPIDFFRTGGLFYTYVIIFFSIITPILDSFCISPILFKVLRCKKITMEDLTGKCLDLTNQYCNVLLIILLISIYATFSPLLFIVLFFYLNKKYYFDKYIVVASSLPPPPSDKLLIEPLQNCIWFVITVMPAAHLLYTIGIFRTDMMFIYLFLLVVGFGRYVPSCSKSLCYSVCDGAILPWFDNPNRIDDEDEEYIEGLDNEMADLNDQPQPQQPPYPPSSSSSSPQQQQAPHRRRTNAHPSSDQDNDNNNNNINSVVIQSDQNEKEMKEINGHNNDKETILNIEQQYSLSQGRFSFLYRFRLPKPKSITIIQYSSPFFNTSHSQCIIHDEEE